jgi:hypothetical protein
MARLAIPGATYGITAETWLEKTLSTALEFIEVTT